MRISRLEFKNFRTFSHALLENIPNMVVLVSPNGRGKSSVLEAIAVAHDLVVPYYTTNYQFNATWQQRGYPTWPPHLSDPVKLGEHKAEVRLSIHPTGKEPEYLAKANKGTGEGEVEFFIENGRFIVHKRVTPTATQLFQYHSPKEGVGFIDYIKPVRYYSNRPVGNFSNELSDDYTRTVFSEIHQPFSHHEKFSSFKSYIVGTQLNDLTHLQKTGTVQDSLAVFKDVFNFFFAPKRFVGYTTSESGDQPRIVVETPMGEHDVDDLSSGEKEILFQLAHLYRFRDLHNIVLWDTPELHLNAALESRLYHAILQVAPNNQTWIATHSIELISSVPLSNVFVIEQHGASATIKPASGDDRKARISMYRDLGAQVGLQLVSSVVAFVEGKEAHSDKRVLDRLVTSQLPGVNFIAGESCDNILSVGTKANNLLAEVCANGDFFAVVDRDYRTTAEARELEARYKGRLFVWGVHEIENLFLNVHIVFETLKFMDRLPTTAVEEDVKVQIKQAATDVREWIAADWVAWELDQQFQCPTRRIAGDKPKESLDKFVDALQKRLTATTSKAVIDNGHVEKLKNVESILLGSDWSKILPGKQILGRFLQNYPGLEKEDFLGAAISIVLDKKISLPEIDRLKTALHSVTPK